LGPLALVVGGLGGPGGVLSHGALAARLGLDDGEEMLLLMRVEVHDSVLTRHGRST